MKKTLRRVVAVLMIAAFLLTMIPDLGIISSDVYGATTYGTTTGLVKENGRWIFVRNGRFDSSFTGFAKSTSNGKWYYAKNGVYDPSYTGLAKSIKDGKWYYAKNGAYDNSFTGLVKYKEKWHAVYKGALATDFTGIVKNPNTGKWYFVRNGVYDKSFTGLAKSIINKKWYYVKKGALDLSYTGLAKSAKNGKWYYAKNGELNKKFTGFVQYKKKWYVVDKGEYANTFTGIAKNHSNGNWYYATNGIYNKSFTGIGKSIANGKNYYVVKGKANLKYNGTITYQGQKYQVTNGLATEKKEAITSETNGFVKVGDQWRYYQNGVFATSLTGLAKKEADGKWYYVRNGVYDSTYTGLAKSTKDGKLYYANKGKWDKTYTGLVEHESKFYAVKDGAVAYDFTGACQKLADKKWYYVKNGVYTKGFNGVAKAITGSKKYYMKNSVADTSYNAIYHATDGVDYYVENGVAYTRNDVLNSNLQNSAVIGNIMKSKAAQYSYEVRPILAPLGRLIFVKTDNPDPTSFYLIDESSKYGETIWKRSGKYADVVYENTKTLRVNGGYIFETLEGSSDGGAISLMLKTPGVDEEIYGNEYAKKNALMTNIGTKAGQFSDFADYLIKTYTTSSMSFFDKMSAIQTAVNDINIYPFPVRDRNKEGYTKYPYMQVPGHKDQYWMYKEYESVGGDFDDGILAISAYFMVADSLSTPSFMGSVARRLNSKCEVKWDEYSHAYVNVTYNGETRSYGGAGSGGSNILFSDRIIKDFKFDGSSNDFAKGLTADKMKNRLMSYKQQANQDAEGYKGVLEGEEYAEKTAKGAWLRTRYGREYRFIYALKGWEPYCIWVDGKYIDENHRVEWAAKFNDHPEADVLLHNISYVDRDGIQHTNEDVIFCYDMDRKKWIGEEYYYGYYVEESSIPKEMIRTATEIKNLKVDQYTKAIPDTTLAYDGSLYPGTPVKTVRVTGVNIVSSIKAKVGQTIETTLPDYDFKCVISPSNASLTDTVWTSSNPDIADFEYYMGRYLRLECKKKGTVTVTVMTADGKFKDTCKVIIE